MHSGCSSRPLRALPVAVLLGAATAACTAFMPQPGTPAGTSVGHAADGWLVGGLPVPEAAEGLVAYRSHGQRHASRRMAALLAETAATLARRYDGFVLRVGDISARSGGQIPGHRSHQAGIDVDILFQVRDADGRIVGEPCFAKFGADGVAVGERRPRRLDRERNWALIEHLLVQYADEVQWVFVSRGVETALLTYALAAGAPLAVVERAVAVLHEPSDALPHDDHFHVRLYCAPEDRAAGCIDRPPIWPWVRRTYDRQPHAPTDDATLLRLALGAL